MYDILGPLFAMGLFKSTSTRMRRPVSMDLFFNIAGPVIADIYAPCPQVAISYFPLSGL